MMYGCNRIPNRPIDEALTAKQLSEVVAHDTAFASFYEFIRANFDSMPPAEREKFRAVTYHRMYDFRKFSEDSLYWRPLTEQWQAAWNRLYGTYTQQADSIIRYWKEYRLQHSLSNYVHIALTALTRDGDWTFELTPLKGSVQQLHFKYKYVAKSDDKDGVPSGFYGWEQGTVAKPFARPVHYSLAGSEHDKALLMQYTDADAFLKEYNLYTIVTALTVHGKELSIDDFSLPVGVEMCLDYGIKQDSLLWDYYRSEVITDLLYDKYVSETAYTQQKTDSIRRQKDPLCYRFYQFGSRPAYLYSSTISSSR
jgi:hypothetical protein